LNHQNQQKKTKTIDDNSNKNDRLSSPLKRINGHNSVVVYQIDQDKNNMKNDSSTLDTLEEVEEEETSPSSSKQVNKSNRQSRFNLRSNTSSL
jgi:hypothetical protein